VQTGKRQSQQMATSAITKNSGAVGQRRQRRETIPRTRSNRSATRRKKESLISRYSMLIQWSDEDRAFIVTLPEFGGCKTHGDNYEEAAKNGHEVLELLIQSSLEDGDPLPIPAKYLAAACVST
jgi:antitoxin HicB